MFLEILSKFKLALYYLINTCLKIATSRSCCTSRNSLVQNSLDQKQCRLAGFLIPDYNYDYTEVPLKHLAAWNLIDFLFIQDGTKKFPSHSLRE